MTIVKMMIVATIMAMGVVVVCSLSNTRGERKNISTYLPSDLSATARAKQEDRDSQTTVLYRKISKV